MRMHSQTHSKLKGIDFAVHIKSNLIIWEMFKNTFFAICYHYAQDTVKMLRSFMQFPHNKAYKGKIDFLLTIKFNKNEILLQKYHTQ